MTDLFPRAPLSNTIFQLRFAGETAVEAARPRLQDRLRNDLPKLFVPRIAPGVAPALQGYIFRSEDESEGVDLALNSFAYVTGKYRGFDTFSARCLRFFDVFRESVQVHRPNRLGLRYINRIPVLRSEPNEPIPLDDYLRIGIDGPDMLANKGFVEFAAKWRVQLDPGLMRIHVEHQVDSGREFLLLDFDYSETKGVNLHAVPSFLDRAHRATKQLFMEVITPQYLDFIRRAE